MTKEFPYRKLVSFNETQRDYLKKQGLNANALLRRLLDTHMKRGVVPPEDLMSDDEVKELSRLLGS